MTAQPEPTYPCEDCTVVRGEFCWTCPLPMQHLRIMPRCEFCGDEATTGIVTQTRSEGDYGVKFIGFDTIPICGKPECLEEAEYLRRMTQ